ncbi:MAG: putative signal transducing protein [Candidatus Eiseniibacteriota bacterium]
MRQVFVATDPTEAQVVRSLLDARGIEAEVHGEALWGAFAAVPMTVDTPPTVWVLDDADEIEALKIIEEYAAASEPPAAPAGTWKCAACGEELEPQFDECWKCGARRSDP